MSPTTKTQQRFQEAAERVDALLSDSVLHGRIDAELAKAINSTVAEALEAGIAVVAQADQESQRLLRQRRRSSWFGRRS